MDYGLTSAYGATAGDAGLVTSHSVTLTGLTAGTLYHYQVNSSDGSGNNASESDATFTTGPGSPVNAAPRIETGLIGFTKQVIDDTVVATHEALGADLDGDQDLDVVATDYGNGAVFWYENDGVGGFAKRTLDGGLVGAYPAQAVEYIYDVMRDFVGHGVFEIVAEIPGEDMRVVADFPLSTAHPVHACGSAAQFKRDRDVRKLAPEQHTGQRDAAAGGLHCLWRLLGGEWG